MNQLASPKQPLLFDVIRSLLAGFFILLAYAATQLIDGGLLVPALGASAYIMFIIPESKPANPRNIIGAYLSGGFAGLLSNWIMTTWWTGLDQGDVAVALFCALAVFLTAFCMKRFAVGHPPAAAMTISVTLAQQPLIMALAALCVVLLLCLCRQVMLWSFTRMTAKNSATLGGN